MNKFADLRKLKIDYKRETKEAINGEIDAIANMIESGDFEHVWVSSGSQDWLNTHETFTKLAAVIRARKKPI